MSRFLLSREEIAEEYVRTNSVHYNEYDENYNITYRLHVDYDWDELGYDHLTNKIIFRYKCWKINKNIQFMNIICK